MLDVLIVDDARFFILDHSLFKRQTSYFCPGTDPLYVKGCWFKCQSEVPPVHRTSREQEVLLTKGIAARFLFSSSESSVGCATVNRGPSISPVEINPLASSVKISKSKTQRRHPTYIVIFTVYISLHLPHVVIGVITIDDFQNRD